MLAIKPLSIFSSYSKRKIYKRVPLTREGEAFLFERIERGGPDALRAKDKIIASNQGIIKFIATYYKNFTSLPFDDLMQEGNIGLLIAIEKFDYRRGYKFSTYAKWWVRANMIKAIQEGGRTIIIPGKIHQQNYQFNLIRRDFLQSEGREPTDQELSELTGIPAEKIKRLMQAHPVRKVLSLDKEIFKDDPLGPVLVEREISPYPAQDELVDSKLKLERIEACLPALTRNQRRVLQLRFGSDEPTLEKVALKLGITYQRVEQLEAKAIKRLKIMLSGDGNNQTDKTAARESKGLVNPEQSVPGEVPPEVYTINLFTCFGRLPKKVKSALKATKLFRFPQALLDNGKDLDLPVAIHYGASRGLKQYFHKVSAEILGQSVDFILLSTKDPKEIRKGKVCLIFNTFEIGQNSLSNFATMLSSIQYIEMMTS